jgi:hypothetical protein
VETVKAVKTVNIPFQFSEEILKLLKDFRSMVNYCLDVGLKEFIFIFLHLSPIGCG